MPDTPRPAGTSAPASTPASGQLHTHLRVPLDVQPLLATLAAHAVPGVERVTTAPDGRAGTVERLVRTAHGPVRVVAHLAPDDVEVRSDTPLDEGATDLARRWFHLDDDLAVISSDLARDPTLASLVARRPHLRLLGHVDGFEVAAQTVLGQQVSLAAARVFTGRLAAAYGTPGAADLTLFPTPATIAHADPDEVRAAVRVPAARARTLVALAQACQDGLALTAHNEPDARDEARRRLLAVPGIGPWTVEYLALRVLADRDAFPTGDLVLRRALGVKTPAQVAAAGAAWSPWRAYAAQHLWNAAAYER
ncbi:DNA-3-methyladenine glycosylase family protein [Cellulomonas composti]|uniref:DNA-3-methyladenine glycosylase II n=1 Tax=Cellulomonas composti TaxID=266130 RepID=A0A511J9L0_9CELL|nr:AlkA N-terminal domain-containing protein [Cellulomonas composti]GEL94668.1 hypothetical protein CCO02nite_13260 [Cellulomonas composti]